MSHYISKVHRTHENGDVDFIYYCGNYHWSSNPENRLIFDTPEEAAAHLYDFGGAVTDVEPEPYNPPAAPTTTVEATPIVEEEPAVQEEPVVEEPAVQEEPVVEEPAVQEEPINFSSSSTSTIVF